MSSVEHKHDETTALCWSGLRAMAWREWRIASRQRAEWLQPLAFFMLIVALFPLGLSGDAAILRHFAPGIIWIAALLAVLLSLERLFREDFLDGTLEQWVLSSQPLTALIMVKVLLHWCLNGGGLVVITPGLAMMLGLSWHEAKIMALSLLPGSFILAWLGALGAALTVSLPRGGVLLSLLLLPLYVPILIFGAGLTQLVSQGHPWIPVLSLLGGLMAFSLVTAPWAVAHALRLHVETQ